MNTDKTKKKNNIQTKEIECSRKYFLSTGRNDRYYKLV